MGVDIPLPGPLDIWLAYQKADGLQNSFEGNIFPDGALDGGEINRFFSLVTNGLLWWAAWKTRTIS
jgi:hypothetical protein